MKDMDNFIIDAETLASLKTLQDENAQLKHQIRDLKTVLAENGIEAEGIVASIRTEEEQICLDGISHLATVFKNGTYTKEDALVFDILHKNYRMIKGKTVEAPKKKATKEEIGNLLQLVDGMGNGKSE